MSERRRSLFVLLIVLGLLAGSLYVVSTKDTKLGLDLQGGVQLIYEGKPTAQQPTVTSEALQRSLDIMRDRVDAFGVSEPELLQSGDNQIEVNLPGVEDAERAAAQVGSTAQLFFYDWEANILDEDCRTDPDENANNRTAISGFYNAVLAASKCDAQADGNNNAADAPRFYAFNKETKQPYNNGAPSESEEAATADLTEEEKANAEVHRGARGHPRRPRRRSPTPRRPSRTATGSSRTTRRSRAPTSRTPSRTSTRRASRSSRSTSRTRAARRSTTSRGRSPSAASTTRCRPTSRRTPPSTSRSCWTTS